MVAVREFDEILNIRREINDIDIRLYELKQMTQPKAQIISDMPRGGDRKNLIEEYVIKAEALHKKRDTLCYAIKEKWQGIESLFVVCGVKAEERYVMWLRFFNGLPWKKCSKEMCNEYKSDKWNEQRLFRVYRSVLVKVNKRIK